jgi:hypothetical protein
MSYGPPLRKPEACVSFESASESVREGGGKLPTVYTPRNIQPIIAAMSMHTDDAFHSLYRELLLHFLADLMTATDTAATPEAFGRAVQAYFEDLRPWVCPAAAPSTPRAVFPLFADCTMHEDTEVTAVRLSPEGEAFFRAWVRRQTVQREVAFAIDRPRAH